MGDNRKDDVRIYIIFFFFFVCSTTGGILLCLYIFLPSAHNGGESWFAIIGLVLVAIPWIVWFLIYIYRCFKPTMTDAGGQFRDRNSHDSNNNNNKPSSDGTPKSAAAPSEAFARPSVSSYESVATHSQNNGGGGGERHVHFGAVVVVEHGSSRGSNSSHDQRQYNKAAVDRREEFSGELECKEHEDSMSESERPLTSVTRS